MRRASVSAVLAAMTLGGCFALDWDYGKPGGGAGGTPSTVSAGGAGGSSTTSQASTTSTTSTHAATSSGGTGGANPCPVSADCTKCVDYNSCFNCLAGKFPAGSQIWIPWGNCVTCTACYTACDGMVAGCASAPAMTDPCDTGTGQAACTACVTCADQGTCKTLNDNCNASPDCLQFDTLQAMCPLN